VHETKETFRNSCDNDTLIHSTFYTPTPLCQTLVKYLLLLECLVLVQQFV